MRPTQEAYTELQQAYDYFNKRLFEGALPLCLITLHRKKRTYGYFMHKAFVNRAGATTDEIAMNPEHFSKPIRETLQTLVHEMAHLWQAHLGNPGRARYHNKEWGDKMEAVGLMPSNTGQPGGKKTGDQMMDYVIVGGRFEAVADELLTSDFTLSWMDRFQAEAGEEGGGEGEGEEKPKPNKSNRLKYRCPTCGAQVWGKPELRVRCGQCPEGSLFEEAG